jgi:large subunit ribosomal protein L10
MSAVGMKEKKEVVASVKEAVDASSIVVFADFRGLKVSEVTELRKQLKTENASIRVVKNTLARKALAELNIEYPASYLVGPGAIVNTDSDAAKVSKILVDFSKQSENLKLKGGLLEKSVIDLETINKLAKLPSREELIAKVVGGIKSPLTSLVYALSSPINGIVAVLHQIKESKEKNQEVK